jgi:hypothetical protein
LYRGSAAAAEAQRQHGGFRVAILSVRLAMTGNDSIL